MTRLVYPFDHPHVGLPQERRALLGGKGLSLADMTSKLGLPVPPGFTITTEACRTYLRDGSVPGLWDEVDEALGTLEATMGRRLGDPAAPLLVSVRSGAAASMPGMMDTVLNLGLTEDTVTGLGEVTNPRFALDSYRRLLSLWARVVLGLPPEPFDRLLAEAMAAADVEHELELDESALRTLCDGHLELLEDQTGTSFPQDPADQLRDAVGAVFGSWQSPRAKVYREHEGIPHDLGTAVTVQTMVFGNRDERSGTGVAFTRDPATGAPESYGDFLVGAQGEDVVSGSHQTDDLEALRQRFPDLHTELLDVFDRLERHHRDMCDVELTVESGRLWILQSRVGKRTGAAALRIAVDLVQQSSWSITSAEAVERVTAEHLEQVAHATGTASGGAGGAPVVTTGIGASPGVATGRACFSADDCVAGVDRGEQVILVRAETSPEDVHGMQVAEGVLTARGGLASHAALVARGWGIPAVVGAEGLEVLGRTARLGDLVVADGDTISIDGATGAVMLGAAASAALGPPPELETLLGWADDLASADAGRVAAGPSGLRAAARTARERLDAAHAALDRR